MCDALFQARSSAEQARHRPMRGFTLVAQPLTGIKPSANA
jgi:hypothetical protein